MATSKIPGLYWDKITGKVSIDKHLPGIGRIRKCGHASNWTGAQQFYWEAIKSAEQAKTESQRQTVSFRAAATKYLKEENKRSIRRDAECLQQVEPFIGDLDLDRVHQDTLQPYIEHRRAAGIKSATVRRELAVVCRVLTLAARVWRDGDGKPWLQTIPLIRPPDWDDKAEAYPLSWDEQRRLMQGLPPYLAEMALFAVNTGAREGVICNLRWEWEARVPELNTSVFIVPGRYTKNGTDCLIVLNSAAHSVVQARRGQHATHVFTYRGQPIAKIGNSAWRRAWDAAGLPTGKSVLSGPHNLRHTFARRLRQAGVPLETRKVLMHHVDGDVTLHYSPAEIRELLGAVESLEQSKSMTVLRVVKLIDDAA